MKDAPELIEDRPLDEDLNRPQRMEVTWRRVMLLVASTLMAVLAYVVALRVAELPREAAYMAGIFVLAALLWITEAIPLFATSLLIVGLQVLLLANPGGWAGLGFVEGVSPSTQAFIATAADPVIVIFFGGFLLARAAVSQGVDTALAAAILRPVGARPALALLTIMLVTATFSMWMSNTAAAAMMIALIVPMLDALPKGEPFRKALVLAVAFSANIGGMGTPIGSPPNAVAMGFLRNAGYQVGFLQWMLLAIPLMLLLLAMAWLLLLYLFPPRSRELELTVTPRKLTGRSRYVMVVFAVTVLLWLSEAWHGVPPSIVALLPAIALTAPRILDHHDINSLDWNILILIAGGISLGTGMQLTGLDKSVVMMLTGGASEFGMAVLAILVLATLFLSTFMSNTAAANVLLPVGISFATAAAADPTSAALRTALSIALTASVAMALPISTPPNALAFARGEITSRDMALPGAIIGVVAAILILLGISVAVRLVAS